MLEAVPIDRPAQDFGARTNQIMIALITALDGEMVGGYDGGMVQWT